MHYRLNEHVISRPLYLTIPSQNLRDMLIVLL